MFAEVQFYMTSSQRIVKYTQLPEEPPLETEKDKQLVNWPSKGEIVFDNVTMKYWENLEPSV